MIDQAQTPVGDGVAFARVAADGTIQARRGITSVGLAATIFTVTLAPDSNAARSTTSVQVKNQDGSNIQMVANPVDDDTIEVRGVDAAGVLTAAGFCLMVVRKAVE